MQRVRQRTARKPARRVVGTRGRKGAPNQTTACGDQVLEISESDEKWPFGQGRTGNVEPPPSACDTSRVQRTHVVSMRERGSSSPVRLPQPPAGVQRTETLRIALHKSHCKASPCRIERALMHRPAPRASRPPRAERPAAQSARTRCPSPRQPAMNQPTEPAESRAASETSS